MAAVTVPRRCSKCLETIETTNCKGCEDIFCTKHLTEHRKELSTKLNSHLPVHHRLLQQLLDREKASQSSKDDILSQIHQWETSMIERIRYKAELARDRLDQLTDRGEKAIIKNAQELTKKIVKRDQTEEPFEEDIERLKQSITDIREALNKLIRPSDIELYIEPSHMIDWNHLIYLRKKSMKTVLPLENKQSTKKIIKDVKSSTDSRRERKSTSNYSSESSSSSNSSDDERHSQETNFEYTPFSFMNQVSNEHINNNVQPNPTPLQSEKQLLSPLASTIFSNSLSLSQTKPKTRAPVAIVDPVSHKTIELIWKSPATDTSRTPPEDRSNIEKTSSSSANKTQQQDEWGGWFDELLNASTNT